jgi:hypothetical protein
MCLRIINPQSTDLRPSNPRVASETKVPDVRGTRQEPKIWFEVPTSEV